MGKTGLQIYFVISPRDGEAETMKGISAISIQDFRNERSLTMPQEVVNPTSGEKSIIQNPIPGINYNTEVSYVNGFTKEALITITRKTRKGIETHKYIINNKTCCTFMDENYIVKFGIGEFEFEETFPKEERAEVTRRNVERIRKVALANSKVEVYSDQATSKKSDSEPEK